MTAVRLEKEASGLTGKDVEWLHQFVLRLMIKTDGVPDDRMQAAQS